jgi:hypothetical protein
MNDPEKRTCPFCAEIIKAEAKLCPHCHQWLTLKSFRHPLVMLLVHVVPVTVVWVALAIAMISLFDNFQNPKPYYSEFPDSLKVLESRMNWAQTSDGLRIYITGVLTNTSPVTWKSTEFDCRFFDSRGVMLDAGTGQGYATILPHDDTAFRVSIIPTAPTNGYASFNISVGNARNAKGLF